MKRKIGLSTILLFLLTYHVFAFVPKAEAMEAQANISNIASDDTYIQGGTRADSSFYEEEFLRVKKTNSQNADRENYIRESFIKFDINNLSSESNNIRLDLEIVTDKEGYNLGNDFSSVNINVTDTDWTGEEVTWNSPPKESSDESVVTLTRSEVIDSDYKPSIDVTDYVLEALSEGKTEISFQFVIESEEDDNQITFYSKENNSDKQKPSLTASTIFYSKIESLELKTLVNYELNLPKQIKAYYEDNTFDLVDVSWEDIDPSYYSKEGKFEVFGTIEKSNMKAKASIEVFKDYTGTVYYVDATNGDDENDGMSPEKAWKSLDKVNRQTYLPDDKILLKAGEIWNGQLKPKGNGLEGSPIIIDKYGSSEKRPIINGNGEGDTHLRGAVMLVEQEYWEINNLEVTNDNGQSQDNIDHVRQGILVYSSDQENIKNHIRIRNNYVHDVVSAVPTSVFNNKMSGGIIVLAMYEDINGNPTGKAETHQAGFDDIIIENNTVTDVMKEGIRTKVEGIWGEYQKNNNNIIIRNNFVKDIFGDGIVLAEVASGGVVEKNIVTNPANSNADAKWDDGGWYAGVWAHFTNDALFQYNEVSGAMYGKNDGEAFDADNETYNTVFQYNYSHNNNGGAILFMSTQYNTVYRYNITANDGWRNGEEIFNDHSNDANDERVPEIYNNTIYVGKDINTNIYSGVGDGIYVNFRNNVVLSESDSNNTRFAKVPTKSDSIVENNVFWPGNFASGNGLSEDRLLNDNNLFMDPLLLDTESINEHDKETANIDEFMKDPIQVLRDRVSLFSPTKDSPLIANGVNIDGNTLPLDIMGNPIAENPTIGAIEYVLVDMSPLEKLITVAEDYSNADGKYTEKSFATLESAIVEAELALETIDTEEALADAMTALQVAIDQLTEAETPTDPEETDISELLALIEVAKSYSNADDKYTERSFSILESAIVEAEKSLDMIDSEEALAEAMTALQVAIDQLTEVEAPTDPEDTDISKLSALIEVAKTYSNADDKYTERSFSILESAIVEAEETLDMIESEEALAEAMTALQVAIDQLTEVETPTDSEETDISELSALIEVAKTYSNADSKYTEKSFTTLESAIIEAEESLDTIDSEEALRETMTVLQAAIDQLTEVELPIEPTEPTDPTDSTNPIEQEKPKVDADKETDAPDRQSPEGNKLPATATNMFNLIGIGALLLLIGIGFVFIRRKRQQLNH